MKKNIYSILAATAFVAACSSDIDVTNDIPNDQKEMISFSLSDGAKATRAGFTGAATHLVMRIQSDKRNNESTKLYTKTIASAAVQASGKDYSTVTFDNAYKRYWDDAHGRYSLLSVYAVAIPNGGNNITNNGNTLSALISEGDATKTWGTTATNTIAWQVTTSEQKKDASTVTTPTSNIDQEDLVYSNNIQANTTLGKNGVYRWDYSASTPGYAPSESGGSDHKDGRMLFYQSGMTAGTEATAALTDASGHFDKGHLVFNHALSRISVKIVSGTGFTKAASGVFDLDANGVKFLNMNVKGTLDIQSGIWAHDNTKSTIVTKPSRQTTDDGATPANITSMYYETVAQMLPDYKIHTDGASAGTNMIEFTIDNNTYYITQAQVYAALDVAENSSLITKKSDDNNYIPMEQGKNYYLTITVNKKQVEALTASLNAWADVNASMSLDNTHVEVTTSTTGSEHNDELNLFRCEETLNAINTGSSTANTWSGDYKTNGVATLEEMKYTNSSGEEVSYSPKRWKATNWFYKDNQTAYHLRTLNNLAADESGTNASDKAENVANTSGTTPTSYFKMKNGAQTQDYHWGAPMKTNADLKYSTSTGFTGSLEYGFIAPSNGNGSTSAINITELHMMSNINVVLKTTSGDDKINLRTGSGTTADPYKYATVKITKIFTAADVDMGTGLITTTGSASDETITAPTDNGSNHYFVQTTDATPVDDLTTTNPFTWAVVPQALTRTESSQTVYVGITIITPDNNSYYLVEKLTEIKPTSVGSQAGQQHDTSTAITQWYPNHSYTYTFTLSKKGIEAITCTLADWVTVTGANTGIDLES